VIHPPPPIKVARLAIGPREQHGRHVFKPVGQGVWAAGAIPGGVARAGEEAIDAFEQGCGVLAEFAGGDQCIVGQRTRLVGGLACAGPDLSR
jgi:hypothetical protein